MTIPDWVSFFFCPDDELATLQKTLSLTLDDVISFLLKPKEEAEILPTFKVYYALAAKEEGPEKDQHVLVTDENLKLCQLVKTQHGIKLYY